MRIDLYTKTLLTVIALALLAIALNSLVQPGVTRAADTDLIVLCSSCDYTGKAHENYLTILDRFNGDIWMYSNAAIAGTEEPIKWGRLKTIGTPVKRK